MELVDPVVFRLAIFVLAVFVGYYVVWSVTPALHTPLMAVTNAVSSVIVVGALLAAAAHGAAGEGTPAHVWVSKGAGAVAAALAAVQLAVLVAEVRPALVLPAELGTVMLLLAVAVQAWSALRNRRAWDGVDRRGPADAAPEAAR